ncbi:MAG: DUF6600 domain-containing protein [Candidatus Acidiferrales bacterium]
MRNRLGTMNKFTIERVGPFFIALFLAMAALLAIPCTATAQDDAAQADATQADPPGRVARLNYIQGSVSLQPAGTQDWIDANPNRPLTTGDNLWADQDSRGELHVGSSVLRLSGQTGISFLNLNDQVTQLQLAQGSLYVRVRELGEGEAFEVDTPNLAFSILRPGQYRVNVDPNGGATIIEVWGGSGSVTGGGQAFTLNPGQAFSFSGTDQLTYDAQPLPGRDDFDSWCASRDQREDQSASARYVSRDVIGYNDLDDYGAWSNDPQYGSVWVPNGVAADWAPYHYGHWVFVAPWGWTWVEDEPWGFAPFHYGRWAVIGGRWGWVPGPVGVGVVVGGPIVRPMYAPALVGFVGGGGFSLSIAIGGGAGVAWFPLGPRDVWVPSYHCSALYVQHVNVYNTRVVNVRQVTTVYNNVYVNHNTTVVNHYTYENNVRAVTAVDRDTFVNGRPVGPGSVRISDDQLRNPRVMDRTAVQPTQRSAFGGQANARALPPASLANRRVVTKMTPASNAVPIGHTQPLARGGAPNNGGFARPNNGQPNNQPGNRGGFQQFHQPNGNAGNANAGGNNAARPNNENNNAAHPGSESNNVRPGFRPFTPPNSNANANKNPNGNSQPGDNNRPTFQRPSQNGGAATGNNNPNGNPSFNRNEQQDRAVQPKPNDGAQPENNARPAFHPPSSNEDRSNGNANRPSNTENNSRGGFQPPPSRQAEDKSADRSKPSKESKPPKKDDDKDHKDKNK